MTIPRAGILRLRALNIRDEEVAPRLAQRTGCRPPGGAAPGRAPRRRGWAAPGGQHAEPLVVYDMAQPRVLRLATPPEEAVPGCARQRSGPEPALFLVANCWLFLMLRRPKLARSSGGGSARSSKGQAD